GFGCPAQARATDRGCSRGSATPGRPRRGRPQKPGRTPQMDVRVVPLPTLDQLRAFVLNTLCERDRLDPEHARIRQAPVRRGDRTCGLFFQVEGPRLLRTYAVWAGEEHRILFYDSTGERFAEAKLSDAPDPTKLAA